MPGWKGSNRHATLPADWDLLRAYILRRDRGRCQHIREDTGKPCNQPATHVDHIIPNSEGGTDGYNNLQALCAWHHQQKSGREGARGLRRKKVQPPQPHPGIL